MNCFRVYLRLYSSRIYNTLEFLNLLGFIAQEKELQVATPVFGFGLELLNPSSRPAEPVSKLSFAGEAPHLGQASYQPQRQVHPLSHPVSWGISLWPA